MEIMGKIMEHLKNFWPVYSGIFTVVIIPLLKSIFKPIDVKSDLVEMRKLIDDRDKIEVYPTVIKDGLVSQIAALKFLDYKTFKILSAKELGYWDILNINRSLSYDSFVKFKILNDGNPNEIKFTFSEEKVKKIIESSVCTKRKYWGAFIVLVVMLLTIFSFIPDNSSSLKIYLAVIFMIIAALAEILLLNFTSDLDNALRVKEILEKHDLFINTNSSTDGVNRDAS